MKTIGRKDKIDLPTFKLFNVAAKVDTGAYGCSLHCHHIEVIKKGEQELLSFKILDPEHSKYKDRTFLAEQFTTKKVKNSGGVSEDRFTIKTDIIVFNTRRTVVFSLTDRSDMRYPILLGRTFLRSNYMVDVSKKDISYKQKK